MAESFGARLRRQREQRNISLATIAEQTKIKTSLLEGLERDDVSHWPAGIFRRAYIRAYADAIGLSPDTVVREFVELYPEPAEDLETISEVASGTDSAGRPGSPPTRLRYIFGSALGSLSRFRRAPPKDADAAPFESVLPPFEPAPEVLDAPADETLHIYQRGFMADDSAVAETPPVVQDPSPDLIAIAHLCTELARVDTADRLRSLLGDAATLVDASGLIVWLWDPSRAELRAAIAHGYSDKVIAHLPAVTRNADNATAAAFRTGDACVIRGTDHASGGLAIPLMTPAGPAGVLALELLHGGEQSAPVCAIATICAAMLAQLVGGATAADEDHDRNASVTSAG
jgi:transcriptional regulator with XRE-family HTH domain